MFLSFPIQWLGSGVVLDCVSSWSLHFFLLYNKQRAQAIKMHIKLIRKLLIYIMCTIYLSELCINAKIAC